MRGGSAPWGHAPEPDHSPPMLSWTLRNLAVI